MGARPAVGIIRRREIAEAVDGDALQDQLAGEYAEEHLSALHAARQGFIDEVIEPGETRQRLGWALAMLSRREGGQGDAGNIPL